MSNLRYGTAVTAGAILLGLVTACGAGASLDSGAAAPAAPVTVNGGSAEGAPNMAADQSAPEQARSAVGDTGTDGDASTASTNQVKIAPADRAVIYTAEVSIRAKDVGAAADQAKQIVTGAGGYVADEKSSSSTQNATAVITFKVPPARYADVLTQFGRDLGKRLTMHQGAQDVTEEVADVDSRVRSAKATLDQFRTLLTKANKIGEVLEVEREIANREAELEALQARQKTLASQTSMATITLELRGPLATSPKPKEPDTGFLGGLKTGWRSLVKAVGVGLTVFGVLLPWLVLAAIAWIVVIVVRRRVRPSRAAAEPAREVAVEKVEEVEEEEKARG